MRTNRISITLDITRYDNRMITQFDINNNIVGLMKMQFPYYCYEKPMIHYWISEGLLTNSKTKTLKRDSTIYEYIAVSFQQRRQYIYKSSSSVTFNSNNINICIPLMKFLKRWYLSEQYLCRYNVFSLQKVTISLLYMIY